MSEQPQRYPVIFDPPQRVLVRSQANEQVVILCSKIIFEGTLDDGTDWEAVVSRNEAAAERLRP